MKSCEWRFRDARFSRPTSQLDERLLKVNGTVVNFHFIVVTKTSPRRSTFEMWTGWASSQTLPVLEVVKLTLIGNVMRRSGGTKTWRGSTRPNNLPPDRTKANRRNWVKPTKKRIEKSCLRRAQDVCLASEIYDVVSTLLSGFLYTIMYLILTADTEGFIGADNRVEILSPKHGES